MIPSANVIPAAPKNSVRAWELSYNESGCPVADWQAKPYKNCRWIVADPDLLGGKLAIRGTRLAVSLILECLAAGMSLEEIDESFDSAFPHEALSEVGS